MGNKVLKIGWTRNNPNCIKHYRILEPDLEEVIYDSEGKPILFIEIQPFLSQKGIRKKDITEFIEELKKDGYIYIDPNSEKIDNFGILTDQLYDQLNPKVFSKSFQNKHIVLTDRDCIWKKGDPNIKFFNND